MSMSIETRKISVIGLGYIGLPVAVAFGKLQRTIGFDIDSGRISELREGYDANGELDPPDLRSTDVFFTDHPEDLRKADFHIIAVPTPVKAGHQPDLTMVFKASETVGRILKHGDIVVYESTVYPGATEEECIPVLERSSGLVAGKDFRVGYSPERINPGDREHTFEKIKKIVSGQDAEALRIIAETYGSVVKAGVFPVDSIRVAEAAKVIENIQRDVNIGLMNELALIFDRMGIHTRSVLEAAGTKWNFLKFAPGLVGGHCIGVDPYYLTHKADQLGYIPQVILSGRYVNNDMGKFIAQKTLKEMIQAGFSIRGSTVSVLGLTFKENCRDIRNSRVIDVIQELEQYGVRVQVCDPLARPKDVKEEYGIELVPISSLEPAHAMVVAVAHDEFKALSPGRLKGMVKSPALLMDVKGIYPEKAMRGEGFRIWQL